MHSDRSDDTARDSNDQNRCGYPHRKLCRQRAGQCRVVGRARGNCSGIGGHHPFISNTSSALVMMPIGLATASELGVSALPLMMDVAMGASASFLTPFANGVSLMVYVACGFRVVDFFVILSVF